MAYLRFSDVSAFLFLVSCLVNKVILTQSCICRKLGNDDGVFVVYDGRQNPGD